MGRKNWKSTGLQVFRQWLCGCDIATEISTRMYLLSTGLQQTPEHLEITSPTNKNQTQDVQVQNTFSFSPTPQELEEPIRKFREGSKISKYVVFSESWGSTGDSKPMKKLADAQASKTLWRDETECWGLLGHVLQMNRIRRSHLALQLAPLGEKRNEADQYVHQVEQYSSEGEETSRDDLEQSMEASSRRRWLLASNAPTGVKSWIDADLTLGAM